MKRILSFYSPKFPIYLTYMLQQVEYNPGKFLNWIMRRPNLTQVMYRKELVYTAKSRILLAIIVLFCLVYFVIALAYLLISPVLSILSLAVTPFMVILLTYIVVWSAWMYFEEPRRKRLIATAKVEFKKHKGLKIAVAGSYGKTSMKELLVTILSEAKDVVATPGNRNVPTSHAEWVNKLTGKEDILIIEYGEGSSGDITRLAQLTQPDIGIITGLAPNHLDEYKDLEEVASDFLSLKDFVNPNKLFINEDSSLFKNYDIGELQRYSQDGVLDWKISDVHISIDGTKFKMIKDKKSIRVDSGLLGRHQIGPIAMAVAIADTLGIEKYKIEKAVKKTKPYEHRMEPRFVHGAQIIDDTYNGSIEGFKAGLALLAELPAKRKIYITPGLVDQGIETEKVHRRIGSLIAEANPDKVVLMKNSVTRYITDSLKEFGYEGSITVQDKPLEFYLNLDQIVAAGDLVLMQNDWTDNYA